MGPELERGWVETGRSYESELADLPATLALVDRSPVPEELADLVVTLRSLPSTHVGSGGALAVARFAPQRSARTCYPGTSPAADPGSQTRSGLWLYRLRAQR